MGELTELDPLERMGDPACPRCLEPMEATARAWWCESCRIAVRPED